MKIRHGAMSSRCRAALLAFTRPRSAAAGRRAAAVHHPEPLKFRYMGPRARAASRPSPACPAIPTSTTSGPRPAACGRRPNGGTTFEPIFDDQPVAAIGAIAVADSDPKIVWVGTGESWVIRYSDVMGDGVYVSKDAGKTWKNMGLAETGRISRVIIHPTDPERRLRLRRRPHDGPAGGARRLQDD
jgi:hypothetical protein